MEDTDVEVPGFFFVKLAVFLFGMDVGQVFLHVIDSPFRNRLEYQITYVNLIFPQMIAIHSSEDTTLF